MTRIFLASTIASSVLALGVLGFWLPDARAETKAATELVERCPEANKTPDVTRGARALEHYNRGAVFYEQGDYESAVDEFVAAYCDAPHPQMFFNIAQSFERLLDFETAIAYFQRFLDESAPSSVNLNRARVRVRVLRRLPARVRVASVPPGAQVQLRQAQGLAASGKANADEAILVSGGSYTLEVSAPGHEGISQEIEVAIGQPYSYYFKLERKKGALRVQVEPKTARIFVDQRLVGLGSYSETVDIGRYELRVEGPDRESITRTVAVTAGRTTDESFRLPKPEATGRWELVTFGGTTGLFTSLALASNTEIGALTGTLLVGGGLSIGLISGIVAVPKDIPISTSSFIVTSGLIGALEFGFASSLFFCDTDGSSGESSCNGSAIFGAAAGGLLGGVIFGAVASPRFKLDAGDAALLNSGALWGTAVGSLFYASFDSNPDLVAPLVLAGLNLGIVSGVTLGARVDMSRRRVALVDLAGIGGATLGFATAAALDAKDERLAHSALLGVGVGLIGGALLTRFMDVVDDAPIGPAPQPSISTVRDAAGNSATTVGARLVF